MNTKKKGSRAEHKSMRLLEREGYACTRAAASLGAWDIIGVCSLDVVLVQVKCNRPPRPREMAILRAFAAPVGCRKLVHIWRDHVRAPRIVDID